MFCPGAARLAFHPFMSLKKHLARLRTQPVTVERLGARWTLYPRDWIDNRIFIGRPFEQAQIAFAQHCIESRDLRVFYDCGSNIGLYSVLLGCRVARLAQIHAFEPVKSTWERLQRNLDLNALSDRAAAHNFGLGDVATHTTIALDPQSTGTATLDAKAKAARGFTDSQDIEIKVFDDIFPARETGSEPAFFKIDVEGYEINALKGMARYLRLHDCILQIEAWDGNQDPLIEYLAGLGYAEFHRIGPDIYFEKRPS